MRRGRALGFGLAALALMGAVARPAAAIDADDASIRARTEISNVAGQVGRVYKVAQQAAMDRTSVAERIANGEMVLRNRDYDRAIDILNQVVELHRQGKAPAAASADARFLLGEAYFQSEQYLAARRHYAYVLDNAATHPYEAYSGRSLSRLVDIALRTGHTDGLDDLFARLDQLPAGDASGSLQYARAKVLFAKGDVAAARTAAGAVPSDSRFAHQTQYLLGVILTKQATPVAVEPNAASDDEAPEGEKQDEPASSPRYAAAIEQFRRVTRMPPDTAAHRHVIDLAWMAIGRLFYESDDYLDAAEAYSHVDRKSPEFSTMLYELAWVYVRLGDYQRAQRALEVLSITDPESLKLADGSLLRADLMLRSGQFKKALTLYESVHQRFDPIRKQVATFLETTSDPAVYYDRLVEDELESGERTDELPPMVVEWAREEAEHDRAFAVIDDVTRSRDLVRRSRRLIAKLTAVLASPTRAKAFPEVKAALEQVIGLQNQLTQARLTLAMGMDDVAERESGELGQVRRARRALMKRVRSLPVTGGDFAQRQAAGDRQWNTVSQQLQRLTLEVDRLQAVVNGLKRVMGEADQHGVTANVASRQRFAAEIAANERDLEVYKKRIEQLREAVEMGRVQVGFGDKRYVDDEAARQRFNQLFSREVQLVASGQDDSSAVDYARQISPDLGRADQVEATLLRLRHQLEQQAALRARDLEVLVDTEKRNIERYAAELDSLDQQARVLVGEVAMKNFALVRDKLKGIVLRADVGIVQQAWEVREEQRMRVRTLQRERAREERNLNDELREVLDDAEGTL